MEDIIGDEWKDKSTKVTTEESFGTTKGDLRVYTEGLTPIDFDEYPKVTITTAEDLDKFQYGIVRITVQNSAEEIPYSYLIQIDGLMSCVYSVYAKTLNDLRKATIRQKTVRMYSIFRMLFEKWGGKIGELKRRLQDK